MSRLISLENVNLAYGLHPLLDNAKLQIGENERICLIGRNGAGKSSLLNIIEGTLRADSGEIFRKPHLRISKLEQVLPSHSNQTVFDFVASGLQDQGELLQRYHHILQKVTLDPSEAHLKQLELVQQEIETHNAWKYEQNIEQTLTRLELDGTLLVSQLSGGWLRKAALAKALVLEPDLLLLDEPTNHLDIETIQWLEDQLLNYSGSILFITHDRSLLKKLATRILELDRGNLTSWPGDYDNFLRRKEEMLHAEAQQNAEFDKKLAQEEKWIRQGIKARRTRNEGRVRALKALRSERAQRREVQSTVTFQLNSGEKSGQCVIEAKHIFHQFDNQVVIQDFSTRITRGDRIGLIGRNGIGKSTLLSILLKQLEPTKGEVHLGTKLNVGYFDQKRKTLNLEKTVIENVTQGGSDFIEIDGKKRHVMSYLGDFLFTAERAMTPVKALSGGECARLLLAQLFSKETNLLVLDEPTNDLDIETLELLEEILMQYKGTLLIVSHDREFLDNVITSAFVFEGNGNVEDFVGGYFEWLSEKKTREQKKIIEKPKSVSTITNKKMSYKEQTELENLPKEIEKLEKEQAKLQEITSDSNFYKKDAAEITREMTKLETLGQELEKCYARWEELETKKNG